MTPDHDRRLLANFVQLLDDHKHAYDGFFRDIAAVRYCVVPIDAQQLARVEYALRNMELRLLTIQNCIQTGGLDDAFRDELVKVKTAWQAKKSRVDDYLRAIRGAIETTAEALQPVRNSLAH